MTVSVGQLDAQIMGALLISWGWQVAVIDITDVNRTASRVGIALDTWDFITAGQLSWHLDVEVERAGPRYLGGSGK